MAKSFNILKAGLEARLDAHPDGDAIREATALELARQLAADQRPVDDEHPDA